MMRREASPMDSKSARSEDIRTISWVMASTS